MGATQSLVECDKDLCPSATFDVSRSVRRIVCVSIPAHSSVGQSLFDPMHFAIRGLSP